MLNDLSGEALEKIILAPDQSVREALAAICDSGAQIALVCDPGTRRLLATVTDGDIRRALLKKASLSDKVSKVMNTQFASAVEGDVDAEISATAMRSKGIRHLPILDKAGCINSLRTTFPVNPSPAIDIPVVIMVGGLGSRLRPLTDDTPKPLLELGGKPILERILINFITQGFRRFYFSVNYLSEQIENYFGDGSRWGADIRYVHETTRLGTAGALGNIEDAISTTIIVQNGDLITDFDYDLMIEAHKKADAKATMGLRNIYTQVQFGVVNTQDGMIKSIEEKPRLQHSVNAGIYCLEPAVLERVKPGRYYDMPTLFEDMIEDEEICLGFDVPNTWIDIGTLTELDRARAMFSTEEAV